MRGRSEDFSSGISPDDKKKRIKQRMYNLCALWLTSHVIFKQDKKKYTRALGASANGFESLGYYAAGIVAANMAGVETPLINKLSLLYLGNRLLYVYTYIWLQKNPKLHPLRSLLFECSSVLLLIIWGKAGLKLMRS